MMAELVYLVLSHEEDGLKYLFKTLGNEQPKLVHFDAKKEQPKEDGSFSFTKDRFRVYWGGFGMIEATMCLLREAIERFPEAKRFCLLSGDSLPVTSARQIRDAILANNDEFISLREIEWLPALQNISMKSVSPEQHNAWRFQNFSFLDNDFNPINRPETARRWALSDRQTEQVFGAIDRSLGAISQKLPARAKIFDKLFFGSQWWALTCEAAKFILAEYETNPKITPFFRYFFAPDEHMFQCILGNSNFSERCRHSIMHPRILNFGMDDIRRIRSQEKYLFVRKFDSRTSIDIACAIEGDRYF